MPIKALIEGSAGSGTAHVSQGSLHVIDHGTPPDNLGGALDILPFRQFLQTSAGSTDMAIDGTTPVEFSVAANPATTRDRYITSISILLSDASMEAGLFGGIATLTNGLDFEFSDPSIGIVEIDSAIKRNIDFVRLALGAPAFAGTQNTAFIVGLVSAAPTKDEAIIPVIDMRQTFGFARGLRLPAGSASKLTFRVNDDLTEITEFNIIAFGFEHILT
jgi:hypothetical protein